MIASSSMVVGYSGIGMWLFAAVALLVLLAATFLFSLLAAMGIVWSLSMASGRAFSLRELLLFVSYCGLLAAMLSFGYWQFVA